MRTHIPALFALPLLFAAAPPASAAPTPATILIGGRVVPFQVKPFVGADGQVRAPVDAVALLGARFQVQADGTVLITSAAGRRFTSPYERVGGRLCVPFARVAQALGGTADWQPTTATLTVRARLQMVRQDDRSLAIYTSYPVYYTVRRIDGPERLYVDLYGLDLATAPASIPSQSGAVTHIRSGQLDYQTVRITIDLKQGMAFRVESGVQSSLVRVALADTPATPAVAARPAQFPAPPVAPLPVRPPLVVVNPPVARLPRDPAPVAITRVAYHVVSPALTQIFVSTTGQAKYRTERLDGPDRLAFDLAGAMPERGVQAAQAVGGPFIRAIRVGRLLSGQAAFGRVVLDLTRSVGFTVESHPDGADGGMTYTLNVLTGRPEAPSEAAAVPPLNPLSTSLAGKVVCVDPGHGGSDSGARDEFRTGRVYEKDITLAVGRRLRDLLTRNGATVVMTRTDDSFPSVMARPQLANSRHADYFISIHADSSGGQNSHEGTTVYFHAQSGLCRLMAADIGRRISQQSGLSYNGTKSDTIRFVTGFGVLRGSLMPAVLVETGYMNNDSDLAKLRDDATQQRIAEGVMAGLRDFIRDQVVLARSARGGRAAARRAY